MMVILWKMREKKNEGNDDTMENEGGRNGDTVEKEAAEGRGEWGDRRRKVVGRGGGKGSKKEGVGGSTMTLWRRKQKKKEVGIRRKERVEKKEEKQ